MSELPSNAPGRDAPGRDDPGRDDPAGYAHVPTRVADPAPGAASDEPDYQEPWADEYGQLPPRPRRHLVTPLNAALLAVLLIACGFVGGVLVEKGQGGGSSAASARSGRAFAAGGALAGAGAGGGRGAGAPTVGSASAGVTAGTVSNVSGHTLYVTDPQGDTVAVKAASGAKVSRASSVAVSQIHPGDTVIVQGARRPNGTLTATSIRATAPSAAAGGGFAALFGGGFGNRTGAGAAAGGGAPGGGAPGSGAGGGGSAGGGASGGGASGGGASGGGAAGGGAAGGGDSGGQPLFGKG